MWFSHHHSGRGCGGRLTHLDGGLGLCLEASQQGKRREGVSTAYLSGRRLHGRAGAARGRPWGDQWAGAERGVGGGRAEEAGEGAGEGEGGEEREKEGTCAPEGSAATVHCAKARGQRSDSMMMAGGRWCG